jgi:hypothetical protein
MVVDDYYHLNQNIVQQLFLMYQYKFYLIYQLLVELVHHLNIQQNKNDEKYHLWYILIVDRLLDQMLRNVFELVLLLP